ncbi:translation initiation factor IF-3, mitochondrial-like [Acipenser ruthenus]|uniref:translation initiation factor IF-3, mitochondrial-like n=1 Tax=Acipenser ruthenus TaxID=7906 RepID=UPI00145BD3D5|nr:translation initiation factor IF-3, mitochondrial-like [Acipenser ruthenus]
MAAGCLRRVVCQALRNESRLPGFFCAPRPLSTLSIHTYRKEAINQSRLVLPCLNKGPWVVHTGTRPLTTEDDDEGGPEGRKKKQDPRARKTIGSVGRKIHHRIVQVINEDGENLGNMHRADVIRMLDERGLKLVPLRENADPPVYRLMSGKQIHQEQLKLREKQKAKTGPTQVKELTFSSDIAKHDLETKVKQIQQWVEKRHHVRLTVRKGTASVEKMESLLEEIVQSMPDLATFVTKPKAVKDGRAAMGILRHLSEKELNEYKKQLKQKEQESEGPRQEAGDVANPENTQTKVLHQ